MFMPLQRAALAPQKYIHTRGSVSKKDKNGAFFSTYVFARKYGRARGQIYVFKAGPKGIKRKTFIKLRFFP